MGICVIDSFCCRLLCCCRKLKIDFIVIIEQLLEMCLLVGWLVIVVLGMKKCVFRCLVMLMCNVLGVYLCCCNYVCVWVWLMIRVFLFICVIVVFSIFSIYWLEFWYLVWNGQVIMLQCVLCRVCVWIVGWVSIVLSVLCNVGVGMLICRLVWLEVLLMKVVIFLWNRCDWVVLYGLSRCIVCYWLLFLCIRKVMWLWCSLYWFRFCLLCVISMMFMLLSVLSCLVVVSVILNIDVSVVGVGQCFMYVGLVCVMVVVFISIVYSSVWCRCVVIVGWVLFMWCVFQWYCVVVVLYWQ